MAGCTNIHAVAAAAPSHGSRPAYGQAVGKLQHVEYVVCMEYGLGMSSGMHAARPSSRHSSSCVERDFHAKTWCLSSAAPLLKTARLLGWPFCLVLLCTALSTQTPLPAIEPLDGRHRGGELQLQLLLLPRSDKSPTRKRPRSSAAVT